MNETPIQLRSRPGRSLPVLGLLCSTAGCPSDTPPSDPDGAGDGAGDVAVDVAVEMSTDPDGGSVCSSHHDCPQTWFCFYGRCVADPGLKDLWVSKSGEAFVLATKADGRSMIGG